jgi:protein-tyrosine phosphatase
MPVDKLSRQKLLEQYGSGDGWFQVQKAKFQVAMGGLQDCKTVDWEAVERLVFVCTGNMFRSPYAQAVAESLGIPTASFGVGAKTGMPPTGEAIAKAAERGYNIAHHLATEAVDFRFQKGDLLVAMEPDQARYLRNFPVTWDYPRTLLGLWSEPRFFHLPDPFKADGAYLNVCFARIELAIQGMAERLPQFAEPQVISPEQVREAFVAAKAAVQEERDAFAALTAGAK